MDQFHNKQRLKNIKASLLQMAAGDFSTRIPTSSHDDNIEDIIILINMLSEDMGHSYNPFIHGIPPSGYRIVKQYLFLLNEQFRLLYTSFPLDKKVRKKKPAIFNLIHPKQIQELQKNLKKLHKNGKKNVHCRLTFQNNKGLMASLNCTIFQYGLLQGIFLVVGSQISTDNPLRVSKRTNYYFRERDNSTTPLKVLKTKEDVQKIQQLYLYIQDHLQEKLPRIEELVREIGMNQDKLKKGFKELYHDTIYNVHRKERLNQSYLMLKNTEESVDNVAQLFGFKYTSSFSTLFKKTYGISPSVIRKPE